MTSKKMITALNKQINEEMFSAYLYLSMSSYFQSISMTGFANWMHVQAQEEMSHAMKIYNYILERGGRVVFDALKKPEESWKSPLVVFEAAYDHECFISDCINKLVDLAISEKDHATNNFLQWFVEEQVEEEASADEIVQQLKMIGDHRGGLFMMNREMGTRVFTPPTESE
jgi:ferritin